MASSDQNFSTVLLTVLLTWLAIGQQMSLVNAFGTLETTEFTKQLEFDKGNRTTAGDVNGHSDVTSNTDRLRTASNTISSTSGSSPPNITDTSAGRSTSTAPYEYTVSMTSNQSTASVDTYYLYIRGEELLNYGLPFLLVITTVGNGFAVIVLQHPSFRGSSTGFIMSALAVADALTVYTALIRMWVFHRFQFDLRLISGLGCKFHLVFVYFSPQV